MRVIAGKYKRRILVAVDGKDITRPTSDRIKENMFNLVSNQIEGAVVLDLFAGSGALGIEALSRGAKKVIFVEKNTQAVIAMQTNLDSLKIERDQYNIVKSDVSAFLSGRYLKDKEKIDLIFADPPYQSDWYDRAISEVEKSELTADPCFFVLEMPVERNKHNMSNSETDSNWAQVLARDYGKTRVEIWKKELTLESSLG
jgi:16S rRNA (guanine966-N2)-methyltransferase